MLFVDGENFTIRAQAYAKDNNLLLREGLYYRKNVFVWLPNLPATSISIPGLQENAIRSYYYTSSVGADDALARLRRQLKLLGFNPVVFKRHKGRQRSKGVDIALTKDMLSHAFMNNYDVAVLIAGDGDYVPLIEEVKRLGKVVCTYFFSDYGYNISLFEAADYPYVIDTKFKQSWDQFDESITAVPQS